MGEVYLAQDTTLNRKVAIEVLDGIVWFNYCLVEKGAMEIISFRGWKFRADSYQTGLAYKTIVGTTQSCECQWCANFVAARKDVYPPEMLAALTDLGIDHTKEADLYQQAIDTELRRFSTGGGFIA